MRRLALLFALLPFVVSAQETITVERVLIDGRDAVVESEEAVEIRGGRGRGREEKRHENEAKAHGGAIENSLHATTGPAVCAVAVRCVRPGDHHRRARARGR